MTRRWFVLVPCLAAAVFLAATHPEGLDAQAQTTPTTLEQAIVAATAGNAEGVDPSGGFAQVVPNAPSNLSVGLNGNQAIITWSAPAGGDPALDYLIDVYDRPLAGNPNRVPIINPSPRTGGAVTGLQFPVPSPLPPGTYCLAVRGINGSGVGAPSPEFCATVPGGGGPNCPLLPAPTGFVSNSPAATITVAWNAVPGAVGYELVGAVGGVSGAFPVAGTNFTLNGLPSGTGGLQVRAINACGQRGALSAPLNVTVAGGPGGPAGPNLPPPPGNRAPDPPFGQRLGLPGYGRGVVDQVAAEAGGDLFNSCRDFGGNNNWLFRLVQRLRNIDTRWGLNWKRGNVGDLSQDIVNYHWGPGPDEGSTETYIVDVISGHCGDRPGPNWEDVTELTRERGSIGRWTLGGRAFNP